MGPPRTAAAAAAEADGHHALDVLRTQRGRQPLPQRGGQRAAEEQRAFMTGSARSDQYRSSYASRWRTARRMARASRHASPGRHGRARGRVRVGVDDGQGCVRRRRFIRAGYGAILGLDVVLRNTKLGRQTTAGQKMKHAHQVSVPELGEWLSDTRQGTCARGRVGAGALGGAGAYDRHSAGDAQLSRVSKCLARLTTAAAVTSKIHGVAQTVLVAALTESYARDVPVGEMREGCTERDHRSQRPRFD